MSDSLNTLLQQRFRGHEAPVDPGVWAGIQQQLATAAPASDGVGELFKERFQGHEVPVDPAVWANISSQLGHTAIAGTAAGTAWGWVAAGAAAVVVAAAAFVLAGPEDPAPVAEGREIVQTIGQPVQEEISILQGESEGPVMAPEKPQQEAGVEDPASPSVSRPAKHVAPLNKLAESATPPPAEALVPPAPVQEGAALVTGIITGLEEQVWHQPVTAQPEPGLANIPATPGKADRPATPEPAIEVQDVAPAPLPKLFMPNTFTPNGDGINDTYTVDGDGYQTVFVRVFAMKNNALVFATNNGDPWTGDGCDDGMYMVAVEAHTPDGRTATQGQVVWLNRSRMH